jgi:IrrE N-terminal-like domain
MYTAHDQGAHRQKNARPFPVFFPFPPSLEDTFFAIDTAFGLPLQKTVKRCATECSKCWKHRGDSSSIASSSRKSKLEAQANAFASVLLAPAGELLECVRGRAREGKLSPGDLASLAMDFGMSLEAMAIRLSTLGVISEEDKEHVNRDAVFRTAWRAASQGHWTTPEWPFTDRFVDLVRSAYQRGEIGRAKAARCLEVPLGELSRLGFDEQYDDSAALTVG